MLSAHLHALLVAARQARFRRIVAKLDTDAGRGELVGLIEENTEAMFIPTDQGQAMRVGNPLLITLSIDDNGGVSWGGTKLIVRTAPEALFPPSLDTPASSSSSAPVWKVFLDDIPVVASPWEYYGTSNEALYGDARVRAGIGKITEERDVLVQDGEGGLVGGSFTAVVCLREGCWVTPRLEDGAQDTAVRSWAIRSGLCREGRIAVGSLRDGEVCWVGNGMSGFHRAVICL